MVSSSPIARVRRNAPGPNSLQTVGSAWSFWHNPVEMLVRDHSRYGDIVRYSLGAKNVVHLISHPDHVEHVLLSNNRNYKKYTPHALLRQEIGGGLLLNNDESWFTHRRMTQPAFSPRHFHALSSSTRSQTATMLDSWRQKFRDGEIIDIETEMSKLALRTIGLTILGTDVSREFQEVLDASGGKIGLMLGQMRFTSNNKRFRRAVENLDALIYRVLDERHAIENADDAPIDILSLMMLSRDKDSGEAMSDKQLRDELITLLLAGYDTTSRTLTWIFYSLAKNPDAETLLHQELDSVLQGRAPTFDDLANLPYTPLVIQETMRLLPPNAIISRQAIADDSINGFPIPAGSFVALSQYLAHRHTDFWDDSETFRPERFAPENAATRHRFAYFPFGGGPRQCIGKGLAMMNVSLTLATIAQQFQLRLLPNHVVKFGIEVTLQPIGGLPMTLHSRRSSLS